MPWTRRRKTVTASVAGTCGVVAFLVLLTVVGNWAPLLHWTCGYRTKVAEGVTFVPAILVNSPFGGNATGKGTLPPYFPGSLGYPNRSSWQTSFALNGTASGTFNSVNVSIFQGSSELVLGPGTNSHCSQAFSVVPSQPPYLGTYAGWALGTVSNLSDRGETSSYIPSSYEGYRSLAVFFNNSFTGANAVAISTCKTPARSVTLAANSDSLLVSIGFSLNGKNLTAPFVLPFVESYIYWFPANFGTWQVDNLSAPGGPGGGWAFNYWGSCT